MATKNKIREKLDSIDFELLKLLQDDGRITNADLARKVDLSPPSVLQRVRKLEQLGVIDRFVAILDPGVLDFHIIVFAQVSLSLHQGKPIEEFRVAVAKIPEVLECYHVSGEFDFLLKILVEDMAGYEAFVREKLSLITGIGRIQSCFVLGTAKHSTQLPI